MDNTTKLRCWVSRNCLVRWCYLSSCYADRHAYIKEGRQFGGGERTVKDEAMTENDNVNTEDQRPKELTPRPLTA